MRYNGDGVLVQAGDTCYTQDLAAPLSQILSDGEQTYLYGRDRLAAVGDTRTWQVPDALGSVRMALDDAGAPVYDSGYGYTPFGVVASGAVPEPFGFTGELQQGDLVYLRAPWYDASSGTFLSLDPSRQEQHLYQYASSNPTNMVDPTGELGIFVMGGVNGQGYGWSFDFFEFLAVPFS
jgi:RHS repeat-associated protein